MNLILTRTRKTADGILGTLVIEGLLTEVTVENLEHAIPAGIYDLDIDKSPKFHIFTPHIKVPSRDIVATGGGGDAGLRIHPANWPYQLDGCIAVGDKAELDAVDHSRTAFARLMAVLMNTEEPLTIEIIEAFV
jgi:hypothetical protein